MQINSQKSFFYLTFDFDCPIFINKEPRKKRSHVASKIAKPSIRHSRNTLTTHDEFLEQDVTSQLSCYSYIKIATDEVIAILFGDEYERDLSMIPLSLVLDDEDW